MAFVDFDGDLYRRELVRRGISQRQAAKAAGMTEANLCHCLGHGRVSSRTWGRLVQALYQFPVLDGADELLARVAP